MGAPNLNASSLNVVAAVDTVTPASLSETNLTANAAASAHTYITTSLRCTNNTTTGVQVTINWFDGTNNHRTLFQTVVGGNSSIEACPSRQFLLENWTLKVTVGVANAIEFVHSYLDCH